MSEKTEKEIMVDNLRIMTTVIEMFRDRGYTFPEKYQPEDLLADPVKILEAPFLGNKVFDMKDFPVDVKGTPVYVHIMKDEEPFTGGKHKESVSKDISRNLNPVINDIKPSNKDLEQIYSRVHLLLIFNANRNPSKKYESTKFEQEAFPIYNFEVWAKRRLRFNVTKHVLVGKHVKLSTDEAKEYRARFNLTNQNIQKICWDDPVNRYYYGQPDEIYRIYRVEQGLTYRLVVRKKLASLKIK